MFDSISHWLKRRIINNSTVTSEEWQQALAALPLLKGMSEDELRRLRELAILFMHAKPFAEVQGVVLTRKTN